MMEKDYQPDGWLGMIVGSKLWIDFTDEEQFKESMNGLKRELEDKGKSRNEETDSIDDADNEGKTLFLSLGTEGTANILMQSCYIFSFISSIVFNSFNQT